MVYSDRAVTFLQVKKLVEPVRHLFAVFFFASIGEPIVKPVA